jgi:hypothetical protein
VTDKIMGWTPREGAAEAIAKLIAPSAFSIDEKLAEGRAPKLIVNPIEVELPLKLVGTSEGQGVGGKLVQKERKVRVRGSYTKLPTAVEVDVTTLKLGKSLKVREVSFPDFTLAMAADVPLATVEIPRALRQDQGPKAPEPAKK